MNGMRVLSVKSAVSENRVQYSFLSDRSLSNISISYIYIYINYIYLIIWTVCVFCQWRVLLVETEFCIHFLLTGAYQTSLYPIYIYQLYISYHMNGMRVLSVKSAVSENRVQYSFLSDRSLSNISISYIYIYISIIYILSYEQCACFVSEECC